jgi:hypothetical protein
MVGEAFVNSPNEAALAAQLVARGNIAADTDTKVVSYLAAVTQGASAFNGAIGPFTGVGMQAVPLTAEQLALQNFQGAEATAAARATYQVAKSQPQYGVDIVVDLGASKAASFTDSSFGRIEPGLYYQAQRYEQSRLGEYFSRVRPVDSMDAEIMSNIRVWGNNAEQLAVVEVLPGLRAWKGGVAGGAGQQVLIPTRLQNEYVRPISIEPLFINELKFINRK